MRKYHCGVLLMTDMTIVHGARYSATITLPWPDSWASNETVASHLSDMGFSNVTVTGSGGTRQAEGMWNGATGVGAIDSRLSNIKTLA
jgi:hypothetical protein